MAIEKSAKLDAGTWAKLSTEDYEQFPKIKFEVNLPVVVTFKSEPKEMPSDEGGVYYMFQVISDTHEKIIQSSAWTLLRALKKIEPLTGKTVSIVKKLNKGKQGFEVTEIKINT